jgi:hypothetical protein
MASAARSLMRDSAVDGRFESVPEAPVAAAAASVTATAAGDANSCCSSAATGPGGEQ